MDKYKIQGILNNELNNAGSLSNTRGIDFHNIKARLITPYKKDFLNPLLGCIEKHWVVFDEDKHSEEQGYVIFYSEKDCAFGLGTKTNLQNLHNVGTFIGVYGSFIDALDSM